MSEVYYNEFDDFAASWLRELIADGLIPKGQVDQRSVLDVEASDLKDFKQCHFFAGIGGWAYAARLAQWPADRPIWTGSPPCQPFSVAGKQKGTDDERHLWPVWFNLVRELKPPTIFGEQVSSSIRHGWLDSLQEDLEAENYAVGSIVLPASSVGALHKRDRLWFVAHSISNGSQGWLSGRQDQEREVQRRQARCGSATGIDMAYPNDSNGLLGNTEHSGSHGVTQRGSAEAAGSESGQGQHISLQSQGAGGCSESADICGYSFWNEVQAVQCKDGKVRLIPTEPEIFPLAHGIPNRVGILRGAGNAIVPQVAAEVIKILM